MAIKTVNISFPEQSLREIDEFAKKEALSRSDVLRIGAKRYIRNFTEWQVLQEIGEKQAKKLGLDTEEKIVKILQ
jgi:metal-responsive CopG/Arc/MetJ family transcriptional regulator